MGSKASATTVSGLEFIWKVHQADDRAREEGGVGGDVEALAKEFACTEESIKVALRMSPTRRDLKRASVSDIVGRDDECMYPPLVVSPRQERDVLDRQWAEVARSSLLDFRAELAQRKSEVFVGVFDVLLERGNPSLVNRWISPHARSIGLSRQRVEQMVCDVRRLMRTSDAFSPEILEGIGYQSAEAKGAMK